VSKDLEKMRNRELNEKMDFFLCINEICEERTWEFLASGFSDAFFANLSIDPAQDTIHAIRVIIPNKTRRYEYHGNVVGILKRICK
jgi:hypothetical protein